MNEQILKVISLAEKYLGRPYKYGATVSDAPKAFDCSSFTQYLFKKINIKLPRTALEQIDVGRPVDKKDLRPGDLVFCKGSVGRYNKLHPEGVGHVALYIGQGQVIHAKSLTDKNGKEQGGVVGHNLEDFFSQGWQGARRII